MSETHSHIYPNTHLFLRLPSDILKLIEIKPNTIIDVGKYGAFPSNLLLGRPYHFTYEILDKWDGEAYSRLRVVPPQELNADVITEDATPSESRGESATPMSNGMADGYDLLSEDGTILMKNNRLTIDDASRQTLSQQEIEQLKKSSGGKEIIEKILANHTGLDEKTEFARAKYTLRKTKKYLKRITVLPMDIGTLIQYIMDKEPPRIMEIREEILGLILAHSNVHYSYDKAAQTGNETNKHSGRRWLVADETGGLVVAAMAEKMGILYPTTKSENGEANTATTDTIEGTLNGIAENSSTAPDQQIPAGIDSHTAPSSIPNDSTSQEHSRRDFPPPVSSNSITLLHPAVQPNLSLLKYFGYDTNQPDPTHPLHTHLKPLSWLQLLHPEDDQTYHEPEQVSNTVLQTWKSGKRGMYWKKRRRWERCKSIIDEARAGGFDGLVVASSMDPVTILEHTVPLIRGGGHVVVYSPTPEPLVRLMDLCSKDRRTAYIHMLSKGDIPETDDFPLDPRLFLAPTLQTSRVRDWQVLPGRTHPMMTGRGGAEGYLFTARRVVPLEGAVEARGNFTKKRKAEADAGVAVGGS